MVPPPDVPAPLAAKCPECGAAVREGDGGRFCTYCGTTLPRVVPAGSREARRATRAERLALLRAHPDLERRLAERPSAGGAVAAHGAGALFLLVFSIVAGGMAFMFLSFGRGIAGGMPSFMALVPLLILGLALVGLVKSLSRAATIATAPLRARPAVVVGERSDTRGGKDSVRTSHFVTLEFEDGEREEFSVPGRVVGIVAPDDVGVAYLKADHLVRFRRFDV